MMHKLNILHYFKGRIGLIKGIFKLFTLFKNVKSQVIVTFFGYLCKKHKVFVLIVIKIIK